MAQLTKRDIRGALIDILAEVLEDDVRNAKKESLVKANAVEEKTFAEMLTIKECSEIAKGLSEHTIRQLAIQGKIPSVRTGRGKNGKILISREALLRYLNYGKSE